MKTLTRYIGREVIAAILIVFAGLISLFAFFDLIHELGDVGKANYTIISALIFVALQIPSRMYELFPVAALIGTLFALAQLVVNSEYTVMRASGASLPQITGALLIVGFPLAIITFLAGELVAPSAERLGQQIHDSAMGDTRNVVAQQFQSGFWFRQGTTIANIRSVLADMTVMGVRIYEFDPQSGMRRVRVAESGSFIDNGRWRLTNVATTEILPEGTKVTREPEWTWETQLRPSLLAVHQVAPERLELKALYDNIQVLGRAQTSRFEVAFWNKVLYPASVIVMIFLALPFAQFNRRAGGLGLRIFTGTILGLSFFLVSRLFSNLGVLNAWPPLFSAGFPLVAFISLAIGILWWMERR